VLACLTPTGVVVHAAGRFSTDRSDASREVDSYHQAGAPDSADAVPMPSPPATPEAHSLCPGRPADCLWFALAGPPVWGVRTRLSSRLHSIAGLDCQNRRLGHPDGRTLPCARPNGIPRGVVRRAVSRSIGRGPLTSEGARSRMGSIPLPVLDNLPCWQGRKRQHRAPLWKPGDVANGQSNSDSEAQPSSRKVTRRSGDSEW